MEDDNNNDNKKSTTKATITQHASHDNNNTTRSTTVVETKCHNNKCWFPFRGAYEKFQQRKRSLKPVDSAQTEEWNDAYDPPRPTLSSSSFPLDSVQPQEQKPQQMPQQQQQASPSSSSSTTELLQKKASLVLQDGVVSSVKEAAVATTTSTTQVEQHTEKDEDADVVPAAAPATTMIAAAAAASSSMAPMMYSKGAMEWEAFEHSCELSPLLVDEGCDTNHNNYYEASGHTICSEPLPPKSLSMDDPRNNDDGWMFPSWFPTLGTKHEPPSLPPLPTNLSGEGIEQEIDDDDALDEVLSSLGLDEESVVSGSVFDGLAATVDTRDRATASPAPSLAASLGLAPSAMTTTDEGTSSSLHTIAVIRTDNQQQDSTTLVTTTAATFEQATEKSPTLFDIKNLASVFVVNRDVVTSSKESPTPQQPQQQVVVVSDKKDGGETSEINYVDAVEIEDEGEEKKEDDDGSSHGRLLQQQQQQAIKNQASWSSVSMTSSSRKVGTNSNNHNSIAGIAFKSLSYSFSRDSSVGSSIKSNSSSKMQPPPALSRSRAAAAAEHMVAAEATTTTMDGESTKGSATSVSLPPALKSDRQLAIQVAAAAAAASSKAAAATKQPSVAAAAAAEHHPIHSMADEISDDDDDEEEETSYYNSSSIATADDRYLIHLTKSDAESTMYSDMYSEGDRSQVSSSVGKRQQRPVRTMQRKNVRQTRGGATAAVPTKANSWNQSLEALEVREEDFLRGQLLQQPRATTDENENDDDIEDAEEDTEDDDDDGVHEADDEQDDDDDDDGDDEVSTDYEGVSLVSMGTSQLNDDDEEEDEEPTATSLGRELSEMAQELTRGGPSVLMDWLSLERI